MRLQKLMARAGVGSRRKCETLIQEGKVKVNGEVVTEMGTTVDPSSDVVEYDGNVLSLPHEVTVLMLNKPKGYLSAMADKRDKTVAELVPVDRYPGLFPVGRLDKDTTGLLLFSTDGDLGNALLHPSKGVTKRYVAVVDGALAQEDADRIASGIELEDGMTSPAKCSILEFVDDEGYTLKRADSGDSIDPTATRVSIEIHEGRKRQIRRMFDAIGHPVIELTRTDFGPIGIGDLGLGEWRELTAQEIERLNTVQSN